MSKTASLALQPTLLDRLLSFLDQTAELAARTGEPVYFGL